MLPLPLFAFIACTNGWFPCAGVETLAFRTMRVGLIYAPRTCTRSDFVLRSYAGQSVLDVREWPGPRTWPHVVLPHTRYY